MFHSDKEPDLKKRREELKKALEDFRDANSHSPHNWEVVCNLGSVHMRLGYVALTAKEPSEAKGEFELARNNLKDVLDNMRPDYGFALYEMGRVFRLEGDFSEALRWFAAVRGEVEKVNRQDSTF